MKSSLDKHELLAGIFEGLFKGLGIAVGIGLVIAAAIGVPILFMDSVGCFFSFVASGCNRPGINCFSKQACCSGQILELYSGQSNEGVVYTILFWLAGAGSVIGAIYGFFAQSQENQERPIREREAQEKEERLKKDKEEHRRRESARKREADLEQRGKNASEFQHNPKVDASVPDVFTSILLAASAGHVDAVRRLLEGGADPNTKGPRGRTLMHIAAAKGHEEVLEVLEKWGARYETDSDNLSPLCAAVQSGQLKVIEYFKNQDRNINEVNDSEPLICFAAGVATPEIIKYLVEVCNADVNARVKNSGITPIFVAAMKGKTEIIKYLVEVCNADVNATNNYGETPLVCAVGEGQIESIKCLVRLGAKVNESCTDEGYTVMFLAALGGKIGIMKCLKELGAKVNIKSKDGKTPIDFAIQGGHTEAVEWLRANIG